MPRQIRIMSTTYCAFDPQAEQSLRSVEKTLHDHWGLSRPAWLDAAYYTKLLEM